MALMETRKQDDFSLVCLRERETQKDSSVSMTNGISSTGSVNITRKVPCFRYSTVLCFQLNVGMNGKESIAVRIAGGPIR